MGMTFVPAWMIFRDAAGQGAELCDWVWGRGWLTLPTAWVVVKIWWNYVYVLASVLQRKQTSRT